MTDKKKPLMYSVLSYVIGLWVVIGGGIALFVSFRGPRLAPFGLLGVVQIVVGLATLANGFFFLRRFDRAKTIAMVLIAVFFINLAYAFFALFVLTPRGA